MIRKLLAAAAFAAVIASPALAQEGGAAATEAKYSTTKSTIGDLVKNEKTKAVLVKLLPDLVANPQLEQAYEMKFPDIAQYAPELTPEKLKEVDVELAKVTE